VADEETSGSRPPRSTNGRSDRRAIAAVYDVLAAGIRGEVPAAEIVQCAAGSASDVWTRAIGLEGCGPWLERVRRGRSKEAPAIAAALAPADDVLRAHGEEAVRHALMAVWQLGEIAALAGPLGIRVLALKGVARLLAGETPGWRALADVDLLVDAADAPRLHAALVSACGYAVDEAPTSGRHLPMLSRAGSLPVEVHARLSDDGSDLDRAILDDAFEVAVGGARVLIPSPTARLLHTLEHALVVHRTLRYRLRDIADVATVWRASGVDLDAARRWIGSRRYAKAARTLLAAAEVVGTARAAGDVPRDPARGPAPRAASERAADGDRSRAAWASVRRVAVARLAVPARADLRAVQDPLVFVAGQLAERSPSVLAGLAWRAITRPGKAAATVRGIVARSGRRGRR
jgi:hypothetical protein